MSGAEADINVFEERFQQLIEHAAQYNELPRKVLDDIMGTSGPGDRDNADEAGVLVLAMRACV